MTNENAPNPIYFIVFLLGMLAMGLTSKGRVSEAAPATATATVPLVDQAAIAAHADSAGIPRAAAYALAWMESRDGRKGNAVRGPGRVVVDSIKIIGDDTTVFMRRICREVGRMQINPCAGLQRGNPRCEYRRVRDNVADNYACGMWYYRTLVDRYGDQRKALSRYNGGNPEYAKAALAQTGDWWFRGLLTERDRQ